MPIMGHHDISPYVNYLLTSLKNIWESGKVSMNNLYSIISFSRCLLSSRFISIVKSREQEYDYERNINIFTALLTNPY